MPWPNDNSFDIFPWGSRIFTYFRLILSQGKVGGPAVMPRSTTFCDRETCRDVYGKTELSELSTAQRNCSDRECALCRGEIISMTLYSLSHIKDLRMRIETLAGVHAPMNAWAAKKPECKKIVDSLYREDAIIAHGVTVARQEEVTYCPTEEVQTETSRKRSEIKPDAE